jgi:hypothetical protein
MRIPQHLLVRLLQQRAGTAQTPNGIDALIQAHHKYAGGDSQILHADPDLYIMQRVGYKDDQVDQPGLIYVLNNLGTSGQALR